MTVRPEDATLSQRAGAEPSTPTVPADGRPVDRARPLPPRTTLSRYVILGVLGEGGMGIVYSAYDPQLDRRIAIKLLARGTPERGNARMLREARAMARLSHPNVVKVHDVGTVDGSVFIAMESVHGKTLESLKVSESCSVRRVIDAYVEAGEGLAAAHAVDLIHRDFKPANVMLTNEGRVVVLDFGLAQRAPLDSDLSDPSGRPSSSTATGAVAGTPAYMSPEQYAGDRVGAASDQFSFCVALYEALYGERPFEDMLRTKRRPLPQGIDVPPAVERAIDIGLQLAPADRHPSMRVLVKALAARPSERRRLLWPTVAFAGLGVAGSVGLLLPSRPPKTCAGPFARLEEAYGGRQRDAIVAAFGALSASGAKESGQRFVDHLDRYAREWTEARVEACRTEGHPDESAELHVQRLMCLDERLFALESLATTATEILDEGIHDAVIRAADLPTIGHCSDRAFLLAEVRPPADGAVADEVRAIRRELAALEYRLNVAPLPRKVEALIDRARASGYDPVLAEVLSIGSEMVATYDRAKGRRLARGALLAAERSRYDRGIMISRLVLSKLEHQLGHREVALEHLRHAEAVLARFGAPEHLEVELLQAEARFAALDFRPTEVRAKLERAMELRKSNGTYDSLPVVSSAAFLAEACVKLNDYDCSREHMAHALQVTKDQLGETHPFRGQFLVLAADIELGQGRPAAALELYDRAGPIFEDMAESAFNRAVLANNRAGALVFLGDFAAAEAAFEQAVAITVEAYGSGHPNAVMFESNAAEVLFRDGRFDEACRALAPALEEVRGEFEGSRNTLRRVYALHGDCLRRAGASDEARASYERCLALRDGEVPSGVGYAMGLLGFAELELEQGNLLRAEELAQQVAPLSGDDHDGFGALAKFTLARVRAQAGDLHSALELAHAAEKDLARFPNWPHALADIRSWLAARGSK